MVTLPFIILYETVLGVGSFSKSFKKIGNRITEKVHWYFQIISSHAHKAGLAWYLLKILFKNSNELSRLFYVGVLRSPAWAISAILFCVLAKYT